MIPLRDVIPSRSTPVVTISIIVVNALVFLYQLSLGAGGQAFIFAHGLVPSEFSPITLISSMFLHGGLMHFGGNMLYLWIFGDNVEDRMGHGRFVVFYLMCGIAAAVRSEEHTSELQSQSNLVCRLLLEKKNIDRTIRTIQ